MSPTEHPSRRTSHPFRWFPEFLAFGRRRMRAQGRLLACSLVVGVVAGLGGIVFTAAGQLVTGFTLEGPGGYRPSGPRAEVRFPWVPEWDGPLNLALLIVFPTLGGLLSGALVFRYAPEAEGHGTDAAIAAYHEHGGYIRPRVPLIKLIASALTIGSGGSGGREGPIAQIGAGFGSVFGGLLKLRAADKRVLVAAGMGAGVAAIFRAPLAGALFAAEILYCSPEFEPEVILPAGLASVTSYCTFGVVAHWLGGAAEPWRPLFETPASLVFTSAWELLPYTLLAFVVVVLSMIYVRTFYAVTDAFHHLPLPRSLRPAVGAGLTGVVGVALYLASGRRAEALSVMSYGYGILQEGLLSEAALPAGLLLTIAFGKIVTTSLTIGSGGSGGVFGPSMVIGGCAGGSLGAFLHGFWPWLAPHPGAYIILGMAGFFAAAAKTPFSTIVIVSEMTGDYRLLLPALWVCTIAFLLSDEEPLYRSQVMSRALSPAHQGDFVREVLAGLRVSQFLGGDAAVPSVRAHEPLSAVIASFEAAPYSALPVVDSRGALVGMVSLDELQPAARVVNALPLLVAADFMRTDVQPLHPDDPLDVGMRQFVENDLRVLPVVERSPTPKLLGLVRRTDLAKAYLQKIQGDGKAATA